MKKNSQKSKLKLCGWGQSEKGKGTGYLSLGIQELKPGQVLSVHQFRVSVEGLPQRLEEALRRPPSTGASASSAPLPSHCISKNPTKEIQKYLFSPRDFSATSEK